MTIISESGSAIFMTGVAAGRDNNTKHPYPMGTKEEFTWKAGFLRGRAEIFSQGGHSGLAEEVSRWASYWLEVARSIPEQEAGQ